ncbi:hypothetical protein AOQ87_00195 [Candidatus Riesia pediculischaeffi]|uniref:Lipoprotein signal peptidase n=2 Tax=Candidatus Riesia pediculischaeffi TaxID=428411 RepID=A0A1V0HK60_9ENTR|nr:hypothetical protein AOQ87_00195 [Candidatus Riesia pediculischaeffi]
MCIKPFKKGRNQEICLMKFKKILFLHLFLIFFIFLFDRITKLFLFNIIGLSNTICLSNFLNIRFIRNYGVAFGLFADVRKKFFHFLLFFITLFSLCTLFCHVFKEKSTQKKHVACSMIFAGALGNLVDRLIHGYIIDFIDVHLGKYHLPAFNLADVSIFLGEAMLAYEIFF